jgi:hypothetical protein
MDADPLSLEAKIALAMEHFQAAYARCFWFMPCDLQVTAENLPIIARALMKYGNREDYIVARRLCPSPSSKE